MIWKTSKRSYDLTIHGLIMGILNVTPDSFSDGGLFVSEEKAAAHALQMANEGAAIIDIGGESTRPGAEAVSEEEEKRRVIPILKRLHEELGGRCALSIDTMKAGVAAAALEAGAEIINDVTGLRGDPGMIPLAAQSKAGVIVMHMKGTPRNMQKNPVYGDVVCEVRAFFEESHRLALHGGIEPSRLVYDPGIGFGKTLEHNLTLLKNLEELHINERPLLLGVSRKSFMGTILESEDPGARMWPTVAITSLAREQGARLFRVHDVQQNVEALRMTEAIIASKA